jgi:hypothetical protein
MQARVWALGGMGWTTGRETIRTGRRGALGGASTQPASIVTGSMAQARKVHLAMEFRCGSLGYCGVNGKSASCPDRGICDEPLAAICRSSRRSIFPYIRRKAG